MRRPIAIILLVALLVASFSTLAFAAGPFKGSTPRWQGVQTPPRWGAFPGVGPLGNLELTGEQQEKILELQKKNLETIQNLHNQIQSAHLALRELSLKPASAETADQIRAKIKEIMVLKQQIQEVQNTMYQEFLNLLTPEQLTQLAQHQGLMEKRVGPRMMTPWKRW